MQKEPEFYHASAAQLSVFPRRNGLSRAARLCLNPLPSGSKKEQEENHENEPAGPRNQHCPRCVRHAGAAEAGATGASASAEAAGGAGAQTRGEARAEARAEGAGGGESLVARALRVQQGDAHHRGEEEARRRSGREAEGRGRSALHQRQRPRRSARLDAVQPAPIGKARRSCACLSRLEGRRRGEGRDLRLRQDDAAQVLPRPEEPQLGNRVPRAQPACRGRNPGHAEIANFLIEPRWLVPVEPAGSVLAEHAVAVRDGKIEAVLPAASAEARFGDYERVVLGEHALIPGLVNAHTHAAMTLMRGLADDLPLMSWLEEHIWPAEKRHVSPQFVHDGTLLACAEMLRGGITCFNDMYFFPEAALRAALAAGMRSAHGIIVIEFPSAYAADAADYLRKGLELRDRYGDEPLASFCLAPHAPYTVSDASFKKISTLAAELDLPVHVHLHESEHEIERSLAESGVRPLERLRAMNLLGPNLIAVHAVHLHEAEIALLARHGCSVAHCPSSNLKLASGFAPIAKLAQAGVNIALGTDGAASNNRLDMFQEMRTAALLAKAVAGDAQAMPAAAALNAATLGGARALGLADRIGSIAAGKAADLTAVAIRGPELAPCYDVLSHLVYSAGREHVTHVWVAGELRVRERELQNAAFARLDTRWALWQNSLGALAGH